MPLSLAEQQRLTALYNAARQNDLAQDGQDRLVQMNPPATPQERAALVAFARRYGSQTGRVSNMPGVLSPTALQDQPGMLISTAESYIDQHGGAALAQALHVAQPAPPPPSLPNPPPSGGGQQVAPPPPPPGAVPPPPQVPPQSYNAQALSQALNGQNQSVTGQAHRLVELMRAHQRHAQGTSSQQRAESLWRAYGPFTSEYESGDFAQKPTNEFAEVEKLLALATAGSRTLDQALGDAAFAQQVRDAAIQLDGLGTGAEIERRKRMRVKKADDAKEKRDRERKQYGNELKEKEHAKLRDLFSNYVLEERKAKKERGSFDRLLNPKHAAMVMLRSNSPGAILGGFVLLALQLALLAVAFSVLLTALPVLAIALPVMALRSLFRGQKMSFGRKMGLLFASAALSGLVIGGLALAQSLTGVGVLSMTAGLVTHASSVPGVAMATGWFKSGVALIPGGFGTAMIHTVGGILGAIGPVGWLALLVGAVAMIGFKATKLFQNKHVGLDRSKVKTENLDEKSVEIVYDDLKKVVKQLSGKPKKQVEKLIRVLEGHEEKEGGQPMTIKSAVLQAVNLAKVRDRKSEVPIDTFDPPYVTVMRKQREWDVQQRGPGNAHGRHADLLNPQRVVPDGNGPDNGRILGH